MASKPSLETLILMQRVVDGDLTAVPDLWFLTFGKILDITRTGEEVLRELGDEIEKRFSATEGEEQDKSPQSDVLDELLHTATVIVNNLIVKKPKGL